MHTLYKKETSYTVDWREKAKGVTALSIEEYNVVGRQDPYYGSHLRYRMYAPIIDCVLELPAKSLKKGILEVGCYKLPFFHESVTMDNKQSRTNPIIHDAAITPWPFQDKQFGVCIMSHILEHIDIEKKKQCEAIKEAARIATWIIIALPLNWKPGGNVGHDGINQETLYEWIDGSGIIPWIMFESRYRTNYEQLVFIGKSK